MNSTNKWLLTDEEKDKFIATLTTMKVSRMKARMLLTPLCGCFSRLTPALKLSN